MAKACSGAMPTLQYHPVIVTWIVVPCGTGECLLGSSFSKRMGRRTSASSYKMHSGGVMQQATPFQAIIAASASALH